MVGGVESVGMNDEGPCGEGVCDGDAESEEAATNGFSISAPALLGFTASAL